MHERLQELDLLRALALVGVIVIHAAAWSAPVTVGPTAGGIPLVADLARCSVPAFVLASGFALRLRRKEVADRSAFLGRRWRRTLVPWLCWAPVFLLVGLAHGDFAGGFRHLGDWFAYGGGHLYFLLLIAQLYLVYLCLPAGRARLRVVAGVALAAQVALDAVHTYAPPPSGPLAGLAGQMAHWEAPFYVGYFAAGAALADAWPALRRRRLLLTPAAALATLAAAAVWLATSAAVPADPRVHGTDAFLWPGRTPLVLAGSVLVLSAGTYLAGAPAALARAVHALGARSLGVYLVHPLALLAAGSTLLSGLSGWALLLALTAIALGFGLLSVRLLTLTRWGGAAVGEEKAGPPAGRRRVAAVA